VEIPDNPSQFILGDFGDAPFGEETYIGEVISDLYRAPEIVLGIEWNENIDIWRGIGTGSSCQNDCFVRTTTEGLA
jgi:hypothetical protein